MHINAYHLSFLVDMVEHGPIDNTPPIDVGEGTGSSGPRKPEIGPKPDAAQIVNLHIFTSANATLHDWLGSRLF